MKDSKELKSLVRNKYAQIARQEKQVNQASCCGSGTASQEVYNIMTDNYEGTAGYLEDADLGLGCGLPTAFAQIKPGDSVIDLGSGAGNDCFIARHLTGSQGKVLGIDFTPEMIKKARVNADKLGYNNVEFREGDIEDMPVSDNTADVVVSNCVLNLVPDKTKVFQEIYRILKPGGHFSISDVVLEGQLPPKLQEEAELYAGCVSGAIQKTDYLQKITEAGFEQPQIQKQKPILLPDDILSRYLNEEELKDFKAGKTGIFSISVFARKAGDLARAQERENEQTCCSPDSGCC